MRTHGFYSFLRSSASRLAGIVACATLAVLAGCASHEPTAYKGIASVSELQAVKDDEAPYQYRDTASDFCQYSKLIVDPVMIYDGQDAQFGSVSQEDRKIVADYMQKAFPDTLKDRFTMVALSEPHALRLRLTLTGIETSTPVLSTVTHVLPFGVVMNAGRQAFGANGSFFGDVLYAAEIYDVESNKLIYAYVAKETPDALDITASIGYLDAAKTGVRIGAKHLREALSKSSSGSCGSQKAVAG
jgi:hypothetical protein